MSQHIKKSLLTTGNFSETELNTIISCLKPLQLNKGHRLITEGQFSNNFYFIECGACRHYTIGEDGSETTLNLYIEGDWVFDYKSFVNQQPAEGIIELTEDSEILVLSGIDFHELIKTSDTFFQLGKIFRAAIQNQDYQRKKMKPEEKYARLLSARPQLIQRFPLKWIASYLDITPETISRVRRKIVS